MKFEVLAMNKKSFELMQTKNKEETMKLFEIKIGNSGEMKTKQKKAERT